MAEDIINIGDYRDATDEEDDEDSFVELVDEDGNSVTFEYIMTVEHGGAEYVLLSPAEDAEDEEDADGAEDDDDEEGLVVLRIIPGAEGDEDTYEGVTDGKLLEAIYKKYLEAAENEGFDE